MKLLKKIKLFSKYVCLYFCLFLFFNCTQNKDKDKNKKITIKNCDTIFVVSDSNRIHLYEHDTNTIDFTLLKSIDHQTTEAFFDCQRNILVSPYSFREQRPFSTGPYKGGVTIFDLNGNKTDYEIPDLVNGLFGIYENGFLLSSKKLYSSLIDENLGYVPFEETIDKKFVLDNSSDYPKEMVQDYQSEKKWRIYQYLHFFDLDKKKVTRSYKQNATYGKIYGHEAHLSFGNPALKMNLQTGFKENIIERKTLYTKNGIQLSVPAYSPYKFLDKKTYVITSSRAWDYASSRTSKALKEFVKNTIYEVQDEKLIELSRLSIDIHSSIATDGHIYAFTKNAQTIVRYDPIKKKQTTYRLNLPEKILKNYTIDSIGYTQERFIFSLGGKFGIKGIIFLTNKDFSQMSSIHNVEMNSMSVTSNQGIQPHNI